MRKLVGMAVVVFFWSSVSFAQSAEKGMALCYQIQNSVNALVDFTHTSCLPSAGNTPGSYSFIVVSSQPIFSVDASKKAWLIVAIAAIGDSLNKQLSVSADELWLSDATLMKTRIAHVFPASLAKSLQSRVKSGQMDLEEMYGEIKRNIVQKTIQKK